MDFGQSNVCLYGWYRRQASLGILGWRNRNSVSHSASVSHPACEQSSMKLSRSQQRICQLYPDHMTSVNTGVQLATDECRYQLEWRRWNCPMPANSSLVDVMADLGMVYSIRTVAIIL